MPTSEPTPETVTNAQESISHKMIGVLGRTVLHSLTGPE
jgi:hypothetical protein